MERYVYNKSLVIKGKDVNSFIGMVGGIYDAIWAMMGPDNPLTSRKFKKEVPEAIKLFAEFKAGKRSIIGPFRESGYATLFERRQDENLRIDYFISPHINARQASIQGDQIEKYQRFAEEAKCTLEEVVEQNRADIEG